MNMPNPGRSFHGPSAAWSASKIWIIRSCPGCSGGMEAAAYVNTFHVHIPSKVCGPAQAVGSQVGDKLAHFLIGW